MVGGRGLVELVFDRVSVTVFGARKRSCNAKRGNFIGSIVTQSPDLHIQSQYHLITHKSNTFRSTRILIIISPLASS